MKNFLKVIGKSLVKVSKIAGVGAGAVFATYGPETLNVLSSTNPKLAAIFAVIYTFIDAIKHRDKMTGE